MEYFLVENMGYDGIVITKFSDLYEAESRYEEISKARVEWDEKYPDRPSDKGLILIRGDIMLGESQEEIFN